MSLTNNSNALLKYYFPLFREDIYDNYLKKLSNDLLILFSEFNIVKFDIPAHTSNN